jgi:hypothetical protein
MRLDTRIQLKQINLEYFRYHSSWILYKYFLSNYFIPIQHYNDVQCNKSYEFS